MERLVYSKRHVQNCVMCYAGCQWCNYGMITEEQREQVNKEYKEKLKKERENEK